MSVSSTSDVQATFVATLVDEWIAAGVTDAVVCPGSRSTPLSLALAARAEIRTHVRIDERSAAFFALGRALRSRRPVIIVVTSGTAAMELHAAVAEADLAGVPLIVVTADRPPELHGIGAPQTVRQRELYATLVRRYEEPGVARLEAQASWRPLARRLVESATSAHAGPVHLNAAFVEPLVGQPGPLPPARDGGWRTSSTVDAPFDFDADGRRVLVVLGPGSPEGLGDLAHRRGWVVLTDATGRGGIAHFDALLRHDHVAATLRPDVVIRGGGLPASKVLGQRLREWACPTVAVSTGAPVADPDATVTAVVHASSVDGDASTPGDRDYVDAWTRYEAVAQSVVSDKESAHDLDEPSLARTLVSYGAAHDVPLVVGSSMPIREVEWWSDTARGPVYANRGANGIDGVTSTVLGVAAGERAIGFVGDVTFLHDVSALTDGLGSAGGSAAIVVADNGGGGIFAFLPQASVVDETTFSQVFLTPRHHDLAAIARGFGHRATVVSSRDDLVRALDNTWRADGVHVIVAKVPDVHSNVTRHEELNSAIARALDAQ